MKDLPYYKFYTGEWANGKIVYCSLTAQGLFINLCSTYWTAQGDLQLSKVKRRFKAKKSVYDELINDEIIKINDDNITISFLDEQLVERDKQSKQNSKTAKERWEREKANANALQTQSEGSTESVPLREEQEQEDNKNTPPSIDEVIEYLKEKEYSKEFAIRIHEHYSNQNWLNALGNPVKGWKNTILNNWLSKPANDKYKIKKPIEQKSYKELYEEEYQQSQQNN